MYVKCQTVSNVKLRLIIITVFIMLIKVVGCFFFEFIYLLYVQVSRAQ